MIAMAQPSPIAPPNGEAPPDPPPASGPAESPSPQRPILEAGTLPASEVATLLDVDPGVGLSTPEARRRGEASGLNELEPAEAPTVWALLRDALTEPFVILLAVAGIGAVLLGEVRDGLLVLLGLVPIVGAGVFTEYRAERALEALRAASAPVARVRRDAVVDEIPAAHLVPGDVVLVRAGDVIPADLRLIRAERLLLDRSVLTGESVPEPGLTAPDHRQASLMERRAVAYSGTSVVGGRGEGLVIAIAAATEVGLIAGGLRTEERHRSPLQQELDRLVRILLVVAIGLIVIVTGLGFARGNTAGENFLAGISAAIAAIPEEPPVLLAVILGLGAYRLLRRGVLVRRLSAEETLGAVDLILTDKTGTLTQNRLEVRSILTPKGPLTDPSQRRAVLEAALRAEDDAWAREGGMPAGSFTRALEGAVEAVGGHHRLVGSELIDSLPVDDGRPFSQTRSCTDGIVREDALGAPEAILALVAADGGIEVAERQRWHDLIEATARSGERLVALATRGQSESWRMQALIGFADPPRTGIADALATVTGAGIQTVVVTGDHPETAAAIAREVGLA